VVFFCFPCFLCFFCLFVVVFFFCCFFCLFCLLWFWLLFVCGEEIRVHPAWKGSGVFSRPGTSINTNTLRRSRVLVYFRFLEVEGREKGGNVVVVLSNGDGAASRIIYKSDPRRSRQSQAAGPPREHRPASRFTPVISDYVFAAQDIVQPRWRFFFIEKHFFGLRGAPSPPAAQKLAERRPAHPAHLG